MIPKSMVERMVEVATALFAASICVLAVLVPVAALCAVARLIAWLVTGC